MRSCRQIAEDPSSSSIVSCKPRMPSPTRIVLCGMLAVLLLTYLVAIDRTATMLRDFAFFFASFRVFLEGGGDIYSPAAVASLGLADKGMPLAGTLHGNLNPPFFTLLFSRLGAIPYHAAYWVWSVLSLGAGVAGVCLAGRAAGLRQTDSYLAILVLLFFYFPTLAGVMIGQTGLIVFALVAGGWLALREERDCMGGILLGLALAMKIFFGMFLIYLALTRRWRSLAWTLASFFLCWIAAWVALDSDAYVHYFRALSGVSWYSSNWNASAFGFLTRVFGGSDMTQMISLPVAGKILHLGLATALLVALARSGFSGREAARAEDAFDLGFSLALLSCLLLSPLGWMYYFPLLTIPFLVVIKQSAIFVEATKARLLLLLILLASSFPQLLVHGKDGAHTAFSAGSIYFYALSGLAAFLLAVSRLRKLPFARESAVAAGEEVRPFQIALLALLGFYALAGAVFAMK